MAADARGGERRARPRVQRGSRLLFLLGLFDFLLRASVLGHVILPYKWIITALRGNPKANYRGAGNPALQPPFSRLFGHVGVGVPAPMATSRVESVRRWIRSEERRGGKEGR